MAPNNNKSSRHALAALLVAVAATILGQAPHGAQAQGITNTAVNVIVSGIVPCTAGTNINPATVLAFPNANTQLVCGNTVVATVTTSSTGVFALNLGTLANLLTNAPQIATSLLANQCRVVVTTPLATCNVALAGITGTLTAPVQLLNSTAGCVIGGVAGQAGLRGLVTFTTGFFSMLP